MLNSHYGNQQIYWKCLRQVNNKDNYEELDHDPTVKYQIQITRSQYEHYRWWDEYHMAHKTPQDSNTLYFTKDPQAIKLKPGRPIVNGIGTITQKLSTFVDYHLRSLVPEISTYIKDPTHFLNLIQNTELKPTDLLCYYCACLAATYFLLSLHLNFWEFLEYNFIILYEDVPKHHLHPR